MPRKTAAVTLFMLDKPPRFNEAAARCRGKHPSRAGRPAGASGFNEAAARCRGKRRHVVVAGMRGLASMRPRPDAAENPTWSTAAKTADRLQ